MNRTVNALVTSGLVTRETDEVDGRRVHIDLSATGSDYVNETRRRRDAWFTQHLALLTSEQRRILEQAVPVLKELAEK